MFICNQHSILYRVKVYIYNSYCYVIYTEQAWYNVCIYYDV